MTNDLKLGSLFDGSGGFPLAGSLCGITPDITKNYRLRKVVTV